MLNEYFESFGKDRYRQIPRITCNDGFSISVQASSFHCCSPRDIDGPYTEVECGFPSDAPALIAEFAEDPEDLTGTVYPYTPIRLVEQLIESHGGMKEQS